MAKLIPRLVFSTTLLFGMIGSWLWIGRCGGGLLAGMVGRVTRTATDWNTKMVQPKFLPTQDKVFRKVLANEQHLTIIQGFIKDFFNYQVDLKDIRVLNPYNINNYQTEVSTVSTHADAGDAVTVANCDAGQTEDTNVENGDFKDTASGETSVMAELRLREIIHDVRLAVVDTADLIIEMQLTTQAHFLKRIMLYVAEAYSANYARKAGTGVHYESLKPVWSINIVDFDLDPTARIKPTATDNAITESSVGGGVVFDESLLFCELKDQYNRPVQPELFKVVFFDLRIPSTNPTVEAWRQYFLTGLVPATAPDYLQEAARIIEYQNLTVKERKVFTEEQRARDTYENIIHSQRQYGRAEGRVEGEDRKARSVAGNMLREGYGIDVIARLLEIPADEVISVNSELARQ